VAGAISLPNTESVGRGNLKEKLAIIGTGVAAMGTAHFLQKQYDIHLFDKADYVGGHTNTVNVMEANRHVPIDTGFIVYNEVNYPYLTRLFKELSVPVKNSNMSFSVQYKPTGLEFCGSGIGGLFCQKKNIFSPRHYRLLYNINRFNEEAPKLLDDPKYADYTLGDFIKEFKYHEDMLLQYLIPMSSAVWSTPINKMMDFSAVTLIRFFYNHGFMGLSTQHQWKTVVNGSRTYADIITAPYKDKIRLNSGIEKIIREKGVVKLKYKGGMEEVFDKVVLACHGDTALSLLDSPTSLESETLKHFKYEKNIATLHTDASVMPETKSAWSSWNYRVEKNSNGGWSDSNIVYWMNMLQGVSDTVNYFVSINDPGLVREQFVIKKIDYEHPLFTPDTAKAQKILPELNKQGDIFYCGSYFRYGFHEDAFMSAVDVSRVLSKEPIWN
jgi:uncharacterized protein